MDPTNIPVLAVRITRTVAAKKCRTKASALRELSLDF